MNYFALFNSFLNFWKMLPRRTYTYESRRYKTTSWLSQNTKNQQK